ncbi:hypothetical protein FOZ62_026008 [Perkinsus olseni]|uniref:Uncharacterized protein n=1 Tax=Perkinsus olseni TaxID=32597 RepID=A0A7J6QX19_PEROL|nr:hypothetical protein FOZ62_026008 [Perkinsus olseni]
MSPGRVCSTDDPLWDIIRAKCLGARKASGKSACVIRDNRVGSDEHNTSRLTTDGNQSRNSQPEGPDLLDRSRDDDFCPRSEAEVSMLAKSEEVSLVIGSIGLPVRCPVAASVLPGERVTWATKVHPRARDFFQSHERMIKVLRSIALSIDKESDPILGGDKCVRWHGEVSQDEQDQGIRHAQIRLVKPNENEESEAFVSRVLVFFFATNESFELLMQLPKQPFRMLCGDPLCINLHHIAGELG